MSIWIVIVTMSAITYALRASFLLGARHPLPTAWLHALRFVPPAILAAFVVPTLVGSGNPLAPETFSALLAAGAAALVAWRFQNVLLAVVDGHGGVVGRSGTAVATRCMVFVAQLSTRYP